MNLIRFSSDVECDEATLEVHGYLLAEACGDYLEDNWLRIDVLAAAGEFRGRSSGTVLTSELVRFSEQLHALYDKLEGTVEFSPMETPLRLKLDGDGRGHMQLQGEVFEYGGCHLSFRLSFDQTLLRASIAALDAIIKAFPVRDGG